MTDTGLNAGARRVLAMIGILAVTANPAASAEPVTLKFAGAVPANHWLAVNGLQFWSEELAQQAADAVKTTYFPVGQLGKADDLLGLAQAGVVDVAEVPTPYVADKLPLSGVAELPGMFDNACAGGDALGKLMQPGNVLFDKEMAPARVHVLGAMVFPTYKIFTVDKPIRGVGDFTGLKLRTNGAAMELMAARLGAVSVRMTSTDTYQSLSRHTLDGVFFALLSARPYDIQSVTHHVTQGVSFGSAPIIWVISERKWRALPPALQTTLLGTAAAAVRKVCSFADDHEAAEAEALRQGGMDVITLSGAQKEQFVQPLQAVANDWAAIQDRNGKAGTAALKAYREALAAP